MHSLSKLLAKCSIDGNYKIGQSLKGNFNKRCPYAHSAYIADGKYPQWIYFVVCDPVEAMPTIKMFFAQCNTQWCHVRFERDWGVLKADF